MNSRDYWRNREAKNREKILKDEYAKSLELRGIYQSMQAEVDNQIKAYYQKYADNNAITYAGAEKAVASIDMKAYERKAKRYVENRKNKKLAFSKKANQEMELYNLTMKVNRLEMLKANIGLELLKGYGEIDDFFDAELSGAAYSEHERLAGILGETVGKVNGAEVMPDASYKQPGFVVDDVKEEPFYHTTFSDRIWTNYEELKNTLDTQLARALVNGESSAKLARNLAKAFETSNYNAMRLMVTETARVRVEVQKETYKRNGTSKYTYEALGQNPCVDCADLDGNVFDVNDMKPGQNAPPMHPWCHCSTTPYVDEANYNNWLDSFLDKE